VIRKTSGSNLNEELRRPGQTIMNFGAKLTIAGAAGLFSVVILAGGAFAVGGSMLVADAPGQALQTHGVGATTADQSAASESLKASALASEHPSLSVEAVRRDSAVAIGSIRGDTQKSSQADSNEKSGSEVSLHIDANGNSDSSSGDKARDLEPPLIPAIPAVPALPTIRGDSNVPGIPPFPIGQDGPGKDVVNHGSTVHDH
jgi:hypothetical protein